MNEIKNKPSLLSLHCNKCLKVILNLDTTLIQPCGLHRQQSLGCWDTPRPWIRSTHWRNTNPTAPIFFPLPKLAFAEEIPPLSGDQLHLWSRVTAEEEATLQVTFCLVSLCPCLGCWAFHSRIPGWFRTAVDLREKYFPTPLSSWVQSISAASIWERVGRVVLQLKRC